MGGSKDSSSWFYVAMAVGFCLALAPFVDKRLRAVPAWIRIVLVIIGLAIGGGCVALLLAERAG